MEGGLVEGVSLRVPMEGGPMEGGPMDGGGMLIGPMESAPMEGQGRVPWRGSHLFPDVKHALPFDAQQRPLRAPVELDRAARIFWHHSGRRIGVPRNAIRRVQGVERQRRIELSAITP